jgi:hypothetical protein
MDLIVKIISGAMFMLLIVCAYYLGKLATLVRVLKDDLDAEAERQEILEQHSREGKEMR